MQLRVGLPRRMRAAGAIAAAIALASCRPQTSLAVEQAKQIEASFAAQTQALPPRTIGDITAILDQEKPDPALAERTLAAADPSLGRAEALRQAKQPGRRRRLTE